MKKSIFAAAIAVLLVAVLVVPASANAAGLVVVFHGEGTVNPGLVPPGAGGKVAGTFAFMSDPSGHVGVPAPVGLYCESSKGSCAIHVSGDLDPVGGLGAACNLHHGNSGTGAVHFLPTPHWHLGVKNVIWVAVGETFPITGTYTLPNGSEGPIEGYLQVRGGAPCLTGATNFTVLGVVVAY